MERIADGGAWMDELVVDPAVSWLMMGTRALGDRPWLVIDEKAPVELARRSQLLDERLDDVFAAPEESLGPAAELLAMVEAEGVTVAGDEREHPLVRLGRSVQDDFCLLRRGDREWHLGAAVLCFPSQWRLREKLGLPLRAVHSPTPGYDPVLADRITNLLDRIEGQTVLRRNWFLYVGDELFRPERTPPGVVVPAARCLDELIVRSERQTLRLLPETGWVVFAIRVQHEPVATFVSDGERRSNLANYLEHAPELDLYHRGVSPDQAAALRSAISALSP